MFSRGGGSDITVGQSIYMHLLKAAMGYIVKAELRKDMELLELHQIVIIQTLASMLGYDKGWNLVHIHNPIAAVSLSFWQGFQAKR